MPRLSKPRKQREKERITKKLIDTAYHEAGHAVAAYWFKRQFRYVTIIPDEDSLGQLAQTKDPKSFRPDVWCDRGTVRRLDREIFITLAGPAAARKKSGRGQLTAGDLKDALNAADYMTGSFEQSAAYVSWQPVCAKDFVELDYIWPAIEALAEALLVRKRIGYRTARRIIGGAIETGG